VSADSGLDTGRLARLIALIAFVTTVFMFLAAERLSGGEFTLAVGAIGGIAVVTSVTSFLIALGSSYDKSTAG